MKSLISWNCVAAASGLLAAPAGRFSPAAADGSGLLKGAGFAGGDRFSSSCDWDCDGLDYE